MEAFKQGQEKEPKSINLFDADFEKKIKSEGQIYKRKVEPIKGARQCAKPETIATKLPDGTLESTQEAKPGDWIITGSKGEEFVFFDKKFNGLYVPNEQGGFVPRERRIIAIKNPYDEGVRISAPWGTTEKPAYQDGSPSAMFVAELDQDGNMTNDRYIIGDEEMLLNNYIPVEK
jgi:hypothetical protein